MSPELSISLFRHILGVSPSPEPEQDMKTPTLVDPSFFKKKFVVQRKRSRRKSRRHATTPFIPLVRSLNSFTLLGLDEEMDRQIRLPYT
jgi:hypothetical protein